MSRRPRLAWTAGRVPSRLLRVVAALAVVAVVPLAASSASPPREPVPASPAVDFAAFDEVERSLPFASVGDVVLEARPADVRIVGFHEASYPDALELDPAEDGWDEAVEVLPSRARPTPPTSAVDVMLDPEALPVSPVDGEVVEVRDYHLYDDVDDVQVEIRPDADPSRTVVVLHVEDVAVEEGQVVVAGQTALGERARALPLESQVDRFVDEPAGHLHLEVKNE